MFRLGLVNTLVTHANIKGFGLTPLSGERRGYMPPLLKTKNNNSTKSVYALAFKVLITSRFNDKILGYHFLVHEGCVIMMFYVPQEPKSGNPKFYH
jgi:hypothetical protein